MTGLETHSPRGCWHQPDDTYAGECGCGFTFRGTTLADAKAAWSAHVYTPRPVEVEPFGFWIEQKGADPALLRKPAYIPEPSALRTVTPLFARPVEAEANKALQAQEEAEDARDNCECGGEGQWEHCGPCSVRFGRAIDLRRVALTTPAGGIAEGGERLALEAIKAVTATTKDAVAGLSRIMAIAGSAGVKARYSDLMEDARVRLIVERPRSEWRHLFEDACTIPPAGDGR